MSKTPLADLFGRYQSDVLAFLRNRVATPEQAEDLLQQVFLRMLERADLASLENERAYLFTVARRVLADFYRYQESRRSNASREFVEEDYCDERWAPDRAGRSTEQLQQLAQAVESLSLSLQQSFVLSRVYGYTHREVGEQLGLSPRTVEKHVAIGLATCYRYMRDSESRLAVGQ